MTAPTTTRPSTPSPAAEVLRTETRLFLREPGALFWIMAFPPLLLLVLGAIPTFREPSEDIGGQRVIDLYVPIAVLLAIIMASVQAMPAVLSTYREQRILRRIATTPARPRHLLIAQYVLHAAAVTIGSVVVLMLGRLVYDVRLPGSVGAYLLVFGLALAASLALGGLVSGLVGTARGAATLGTVLFIPMMFTSGVWFPVQVMPGLLGDVVALTPLGAASLALDQAAVGDWPDVKHLVVLLVWTLGLGGSAARYFRWE
jgi:ABC-2 type transport system permease protein